MKIWKFDLTWKKFRNSIEVRSLLFIARFFGVILMVCYIYIGSESFLTLVRRDLNLRHGIDDLAAVIEESIESNEPDKATMWVRFRPLEETAELIKIITPESGSLAPGMFFEISRRELQLQHMDDALFWSQLGRYRLRYDALRCGSPNSTVTVDKALAIFVPPELLGLIHERPELVKKSVQKVLDFDAKYPARNSPVFTCKSVSRAVGSNAQMVPPELWGRIRDTLRSVTEMALKNMEGK